MELMTTQFGSVSFGPQDVIRFDHGLEDIQDDRLWLLLADGAHPELNWLQSISHPETCLPVVSTSRIDSSSLTVPLSTLDGLNEGKPVIVLAMLVQTEDGVSVDRKMPIIIDPNTRRGAQLRIDDVQTAQRALPEKVAPLRKSA